MHKSNGYRDVHNIVYILLVIKIKSINTIYYIDFVRWKTENALKNCDFKFYCYCIFYRLHIMENVYIIELGSGLGLGAG